MATVSIPFQIKTSAGSTTAGRLVIPLQGREMQFAPNQAPDEMRDPVARAAIDLFLATGATSGTVTVASTGS